jgi:CRISPR/Cas system-associated exonuclease Cas4 (RecB family)
MSQVFAPLPPVGEIIPSLQKTVSASRLNTFLQCRLKFYFRYVVKIPKAKSPALHLGGTIHECLKAWNKARWRCHPLTLKQLHDEFMETWDKQEEEPVDWEGEEAEQKATGWRLLESYIRESPIKADEKPDAVEVPVEANLSSRGLPRLVGIIDLVQGGRIVDYKTSSTTPNSATVAHTNETQTSIYAILYRESTGKTEAGIELHHLVKLKSPKFVVTSLPPMNDQQEERLFRVIQSYQHGLEMRDFVPSPGMGCLSCEFFNECRRWH